MIVKRKFLWARFLAIIALLCCALGVWLSAFSAPNNRIETKAAATQVDVTDRLTLENRDWALNGATDHTALGVLVDDAYLVSATNLRKYWNDNGATLTPLNEGCDIMEYILINGESARSLVTKNQSGQSSYVGTTFPFHMGGVFAPVTVETTSQGGGGLWIKVMTAFVGTEYTITFKQGFTLVNSNNEILVLLEDVVYEYVDGALLQPTKMHTLSFEGAESEVQSITVATGAALTNLPEVPEKEGYKGFWTIDGVKIDAETVYEFESDKTAVAQYVEIKIVDITDRLMLEDRAWALNGATDYTALGVLVGEEYLISAANLRKHWNDNGATLTPLNEGCDIMEYILINGESARSLVTKNQSGQSSYVGTAFPFNIGGVFAPVTVETTSRGGGGLWIRVMTAFAGAEYTITLKQGFTLVNSNNETLVVSEDVVFEYSNGNIKKQVKTYTLSFEGAESVVNPIEVEAGATLANLPTVPEKRGYKGFWKIDGVEVNADTVYGYGMDKTATAFYERLEFQIMIFRADGTSEEISFHVDNAASKLAEVRLTEDTEEYSYSWETPIPTALELRNYAFREVATDLKPDTRMISQSVSIGTNFAVNVYVEVVDDKIPQMQFIMGGENIVSEGALVDSDSNKYVYRLENLSADELSVSFTAILLVESEEIDRMVYSVESYLNDLAKTNPSQELKTLIADLVVYGQAAEVCSKGEVKLQNVEGVTATSYVDLTDTDCKVSDSSQEGVEITSLYLSYTKSNRLTIRFTAPTTDGLVVKINGKDVAFAEVEQGSGVYETQTNALFITGCDDRFKITLSVKDTAVQTALYSVKSYVYEKQNGTNKAEANYLKALYNCSASLQAYAKGVTA